MKSLLAITGNKSTNEITCCNKKATNQPMKLLLAITDNKSTNGITSYNNR